MEKMSASAITFAALCAVRTDLKASSPIFAALRAGHEAASRRSAVIGWPRRAGLKTNDPRNEGTSD